jgi:glycine/D-amino acid oxidase-like deaminating enzyme
MIDLLIVGSGIIGATATYVAARQKPGWNILLLDRSLAAKGATAYSAGLDFPYGRTQYQKELTLASRQMYAEFRSAIPVLPIRQLPFVGIVSRSKVQEVVPRFTVDSIHCAHRSEVDQLLRAFPGLRIGPEQEVLLGCVAAMGFVEQVATLLIGSVINAPRVQCWEGVAVTEVRAICGAHEVETLDGRKILARRVLVATGPWILNGPGAGIAGSLGVRIKKVAALHVLQLPSPDSPVVYFFDEDAFLLPVPELGRWIFSFTSQDWDCLPEGGALRIHAGERQSALAVLERYCPEFVLRCLGGQVFCDAYSRDRAPIIAADPEDRDFVVAGACSGAGFRLAPAIACSALHLFPNFSSQGEATL